MIFYGLPYDRRHIAVGNPYTLTAPFAEKHIPWFARVCTLQNFHPKIINLAGAVMLARLLLDLVSKLIAKIFNGPPNEVRRS